MKEYLTYLQVSNEIDEGLTNLNNAGIKTSEIKKILLLTDYYIVFSTALKHDGFPCSCWGIPVELRPDDNREDILFELVNVCDATFIVDGK